MKKALSILLAAAVILGVAAPMAFAAQYSPGSVELWLDNPDPAKPDTAELIHTHNCTATEDPPKDALIYWDVTSFFSGFRVNFRPRPYNPTLPRPDNNTLGTGIMEIQAVASGTVTIVAECQECGDIIGRWDITINPPPTPDVPTDDVLYILRIWWHDLKWTWDYQIHPFFKYVYFSIGDWVSSAWNMLVNAIKGLFNGSDAPPAIVEPLPEPVIVEPIEEVLEAIE